MLQLLPSLAIALSARAWLGGAGAQRQLGLLPFGLEEALLPGETKQVHLFEARFIQLFADAASKSDSCIGQLLFTTQGAIATTSLLEVEEFRKEEYGVWARLKCVGRITLLDIEKTDFDYVRATVEHLVDDEEAPGDASALAETHASVVALQRKLRRQGDDDELSIADSADADDERVEWGHEVRDAEDEQCTGLPVLVAARREVLLSRGPDAEPYSSLHDAVSAIWAVDDDEAAEATLTSFAACATLSVSARVKALAAASVAERCEIALEGLQEQQRRLAALSALQAAGPAK